MKSYLLTWNPMKWAWEEFADEQEEVCRHGSCLSTWSAYSKRIQAGDRVYWMRQGTKPRGIFASGVATGTPFSGEHWDGRDRGPTRYVDVRFDVLLDPESEPILDAACLAAGALAGGPWGHQRSGIEIPPSYASALAHAWRAFLKRRVDRTLDPNEVDGPTEYAEGTLRRVRVNAFERDAAAREACVRAKGFDCSICGFNFEETYGSLGREYIHVHHLKPLSEIRRGYRVSPKRDLIPVCPNCHAMLHRPTSVMTPGELRRAMRAAGSVRRR